MKFTPLFVRALLLFVSATAGATLSAQETPPPPAAAAEPAKRGYTVTVDIKVDEKGDTETVSLVSTDDASTGEFLTKMALVMALKTDLPAREKNGQPAKYTARVPYFFPIADDEGADADLLPKPRVKNAVQPVYPLEMREKGIVGGAIMELVIDETGKLAHLTTLRASHPEFEASAKESLIHWEFSPAMQDGAPVRSRSRIAMVYETENRMAALEWRVAPRPSIGAFMVIRPETPIDESMFENAPEEAAPPQATGAAAPETPAASETPAAEPAR